MRVMHVIKDLDQGGAQVVVRTLAEGQVEAGHSVAVVASPGTISDSVPGQHYDLPETGSNPRLLGPAAWALHRAIRSYRPDVVHAHNPGIMLVAGLATGRGRLVPALATLHGSTREQYPRNVRTARLTGLPTIACGPSVADLMAEHGHPVDRTIINGVHVRPEAIPRGQLREQLGIGSDEVVFVQVGRLASPKRPVEAVEAFARAGAPGTLVLVGGGPLAETVRQRAEELGVAQRVIMTGVRSDAHDLMRAADVVLLSSGFEGLPLVLLEAMSLGRPVLATRAPGIQELVVDGKDGVLTDLDPAALAVGITRLARSDDLRAELGAGAAARREEFSEARMVADYTRAYESVLSGRNRSRHAV